MIKRLKRLYCNMTEHKWRLLTTYPCFQRICTRCKQEESFWLVSALMKTSKYIPTNTNFTSYSAWGEKMLKVMEGFQDMYPDIPQIDNTIADLKAFILKHKGEEF